MTGPVEAALITAEGMGDVPRLEDLGDVAEISQEVVGLADSPIAPLAAVALAAAVTRAQETWASVASAFASRLGNQNSYLALSDSLDALLDVPTAAQAIAPTLYAALLAGQDRCTRERPLVAAARLEGALRIALAGAAPPYLVLHHLAHINGDLSDEYLEALPRLIGIALDQWDTDRLLTEPLMAALRTLRGHAQSAGAAAHELACHQLRVALRQEDAEVASERLMCAANAFSEAVTLDEALDDAAAYAAVCSAVAAFGEGDANRLEEATSTLDAIMRRRIAWHRGMYQPAWRRPALDADIEWLGLVLDLRNAAARLAERSWLETAAAVGQLSRAYTAARSTTPAPGLVAIVRPAIENGVAENAVILDQLTRAVMADRERDVPLLPPGADVLLEAIQHRRSEKRPQGDSGHDGEDNYCDPAADTRIDRLAPQLRRVLVDGELARVVASRLDDQSLSNVGAMVAASTASGVTEHPTLRSLRKRIIDGLSTNPSWQGETSTVVTALLDTTLTFLLDRYDRRSPVVPGLPDILRPVSKKGDRPLESELQHAFYIWVSNSRQFAGRVQMEVPDTATGRVDVVVRAGEIEVVTEVKRELKNATKTSLERQYAAQAAAYSGTNVPFSQLLVLDLTDHTGGVPSLEDLAWVIEHRPRPDASPRHVITGVVVGNRPAPSALKTHRKDA